MLIRLATSWLKRHGKKPPQAYWTPCVVVDEEWKPPLDIVYLADLETRELFAELRRKNSQLNPVRKP